MDWRNWRPRVVAGIVVSFACVAVFATQIFPDHTMRVYWRVEPWFDAAFRPETMIVSVPQDRPAVPYTDAEGYAVMSAFKSRARRRIFIRRELPTEGRLSTPGELRCFSAENRAEYREALEDFIEQNRRRWLLEPRFAPEPAYQFVEEADFSLLAVKHAVPHSRDGARVAITTFLAVGFNRRRDRAVLGVSKYDGFWAGAYFLFFKQGSTWVSLQTPKCGWIE